MPELQLRAWHPLPRLLWASASHPSPCASCPGQWGERGWWEAALCITAGPKQEAFILGGLLIPCACKVSVVQLL